jgi:uncharacterized protein (DUF305 family)
MTVFRAALPALAICLALGGAVAAQSDHSGHAANSPTDPAATAAQDGYKRAMQMMHESMAKVEFSGNADIDFVRAMIPHHQAAVDMAKLVMVHGKDTEIRALAEEIITSQEKEIDLMEAWLKAQEAVK